MFGSTFFNLKFGTFQAFFDMLETCCKLCVVLASFPMLQNITLTTKLSINISSLPIFVGWNYHCIPGVKWPQYCPSKYFGC